MPAPFRNPNSSMLWFRKRVPHDLREVIGTTEIKRSLKTGDPRIAKSLNDRMHAEYDANWAKLRAEALDLDERGVSALAGEFYRRLVERDERNPGDPKRWQIMYACDRMAFHYLPRSPDSKHVVVTNQLNLYYEIRTFLVERGVKLRPPSASAFLHEAARARLLATLRLEGFARKKFDEDPNVTAFPSAERLGRTTWDVLFDEYAAEKHLAERTRRSWKNNIMQLMIFSGVDHPADLVFAHVESFREHLAKTASVSGQTIRNGYIGAARAFLNWCIARAHRSADNPAAAVVVFPDVKPIVRESGLSDKEALAVLAATLGPRAPNISDRTADARRWIPWLCAYTGARIDEIAQLRHEDVRQTTYSPLHPELVWYIDLTPDAGHIKTGVFRHVPIHPDLIELGFLEFVESRNRRRLFIDIAAVRSRKDLRGLTASTSNRLGRWIRTIVDDPKVQPNHGWRHRFISLASTAKMDREKRDIITGHSSESRGARYGYRHPAELLHELTKMVSHLRWLHHTHPALVEHAIATRSMVRPAATKLRRSGKRKSLAPFEADCPTKI